MTAHPARRAALLIWTVLVSASPLFAASGPQSLDQAGLNIITDFPAPNAYTPGIFWSTQGAAR